VALGLAAAAVVTLGGCGRRKPAALSEPLMDVFRKQAQEEGLTREQTEGKRLFADYCVTCHGDSGGGDGQNAYNLDPAPPDFHTSLASHPPSYWKQIVEGGTASVGRSSLCPPWGRNLTAAQVDAIVGYLGVLAKPAPGANAAPKS